MQARDLYASREPDGENTAAMTALMSRQDLYLGDHAAALAGSEQASAVLESGAPYGTHHFDWDARWACVEVFAARPLLILVPALGPRRKKLLRYTCR